ncbi:MAG TPA: bifunctional phosphoribosyl-AMP cyclohydrolase/phosphoribosyl-ATP diphosphatase HisIE [Steroidobacteraceae bacterium]|nr:bifunctional phosphoribosyl-AMP cyclohydrolase/phosphoribosyl-ATP diphosphatase HisIE [Steroidobacteraceae bacterium]
MALSEADIARLDFGKGDGLLPAIVQDGESGAVLMLGYMNQDALRATLERRRVVFFSRSKQRLWEKGETSGHHLELESIEADCDADTLLVRARPLGPACHTGTRTCFGDAAHSEAEQLAFLARLAGIIESRIQDRPEGSYTARLYAQGTQRLAQKVGEEALEVALAAAAETDDKVIGEAADLLFHLLLLLKSRNLSLPRVVAELEARHAAKSGSVLQMKP